MERRDDSLEIDAGPSVSELRCAHVLHGPVRSHPRGAELAHKRVYEMPVESVPHSSLLPAFLSLHVLVGAGRQRRPSRIAPAIRQCASSQKDCEGALQVRPVPGPPAASMVATPCWLRVRASRVAFKASRSLYARAATRLGLAAKTAPRRLEVLGGSVFRGHLRQLLVRCIRNPRPALVLLARL